MLLAHDTEMVYLGPQAGPLDRLFDDLECQEGYLLVLRVHHTLHHGVDHLLQSGTITIRPVVCSQCRVDHIRQLVVDTIDVTLHELELFGESVI